MLIPRARSVCRCFLETMSSLNPRVDRAEVDRSVVALEADSVEIETAAVVVEEILDLVTGLVEVEAKVVVRDVVLVVETEIAGAVAAVVADVLVDSSRGA